MDRVRESMTAIQIRLDWLAAVKQIIPDTKQNTKSTMVRCTYSPVKQGYQKGFLGMIASKEVWW